ncbi:MAG: hypothetical protein H0X40_10730 [Chthoniobacterales bacterium]|nr:hypothetical protein [Chthoniobacterales bacterium]
MSASKVIAKELAKDRLIFHHEDVERAMQLDRCGDLRFAKVFDGGKTQAEGGAFSGCAP